MCSLESRELMALCLKRLKGLPKVKLIDANFVWTEPHSKRIKVKMTVQGEAIAGTILQVYSTMLFFRYENRGVASNPMSRGTTGKKSLICLEGK